MTPANPIPLFPTAPAVSPPPAGHAPTDPYPTSQYSASPYPTSQYSATRPVAGMAVTRPLQPWASGIRVGDAERTRVCDTLATHYAEGRLSPDELDLRLAAATSAVTRSDLMGLLADLPGDEPSRGQPRPLAPQRVRTPSEVTPTDVLTTVGVIGTIAILALMMLGIGIVSPAMFIASFFGGTLAMLLGGGAVHLLYRSRQRRQPPAA